MWSFLGAAIVHKDPHSIESFYCEHYDQEVVIRLLYSPSIFFREKHIPVRLSLLKWGYSVDPVHLHLTCFPKGSKQPTYG